MSNNIVTLEGILSILDHRSVEGQNAATGVIQTISNLEAHPVIVTGKSLETTSDVISALGEGRLWARIQGKLVSFPERTFVFAKSIIPSLHIRAGDAEGFIGNPAYQEVSAITLTGFIHPPKDIGTYTFAGIQWPMVTTAISTDKRYSGGHHRVTLIGDAARIYHLWIRDHNDGFHAVIQGKLETAEGLSGVKALYLRPSSQVNTGPLLDPP